MFMFIKVNRDLVIGNHRKVLRNINPAAVVNSLGLAAIQICENAVFVVGGVSQVSCMN